MERMRARFAEERAQAEIDRRVRDAADNLGLTAIVAFTELGGTARLISKYRPDAMIHAFTPIAATRTRMALYSGVVPLEFARVNSTDEMIATPSAPSSRVKSLITPLPAGASRRGG